MNRTHQSPQCTRNGCYTPQLQLPTQPQKKTQNPRLRSRHLPIQSQHLPNSQQIQIQYNPLKSTPEHMGIRLAGDQPESIEVVLTDTKTMLQDHSTRRQPMLYHLTWPPLCLGILQVCYTQSSYPHHSNRKLGCCRITDGLSGRCRIGGREEIADLKNIVNSYV